MLETANRIKTKIASLEQAVARHVEAVTDPDNATIKSDILASVANKKQEISDLEDQLKRVKDYCR